MIYSAVFDQACAQIHLLASRVHSDFRAGEPTHTTRHLERGVALLCTVGSVLEHGAAKLQPRSERHGEGRASARPRRTTSWRRVASLRRQCGCCFRCVVLGLDAPLLVLHSIRTCCDSLCFVGKFRPLVKAGNRPHGVLARSAGAAQTLATKALARPSTVRLVRHAPPGEAQAHSKARGKTKTACQRRGVEKS